jgi:hypothetical protein
MVEKCRQIVKDSHDSIDMLKRICHAMMQYGNYRMIILSMVDKRKKEKPVAEAGLDDGYLSNPEFQCWFEFIILNDSRLNLTIPMLFEKVKMGSMVVFTSSLGGIDEKEKAALQQISSQIAKRLGELNS